MTPSGIEPVIFQFVAQYLNDCATISGPHVHTVHLDIGKVFYPPTDAQVNCLKTILKFTLKLTLKQLRHISVQSPSSGSAQFELAEVTVVKITH
jgi:hypothetical protein